MAGRRMSGARCDNRTMKTRIIAVVGACTFVTAFLLWLSFRSPAEAEAKSAMRALLNGNVEVLYSYAIPEEISESGLTKDQLKLILDELVTPRLGTVRLIGGTFVSRSGSDGSKAIPIQAVQLANGRVTNVLIDNWHTAEGGKFAVVCNLLRCAWQIEWLSRNPSNQGFRPTWRAMDYGLQADADRLRQLGVKGVYYGPDEGFLTLDEMEARYQRLLRGEIPTSR